MTSKRLSLGSNASSSARPGTALMMRLLICVPVAVNETTRLPASVAMMQPLAVRTPLGPASSALAFTPANGGVAEICVTNKSRLASTTSTALLERSAR
jgi:hypothetical protein